MVPPFLCILLSVIINAQLNLPLKVVQSSTQCVSKFWLGPKFYQVGDKEG